MPSQFHSLLSLQAFGDKNCVPTTIDELSLTHNTPAHKLYEEFMEVVECHFERSNAKDFMIVFEHFAENLKSTLGKDTAN